MSELTVAVRAETKIIVRGEHTKCAERGTCVRGDAVFEFRISGPCNFRARIQIIDWVIHPVPVELYFHFNSWDRLRLHIQSRQVLTP